MLLQTHTRTSHLCARTYDWLLSLYQELLCKCSPDFLEREDGEGECDTAVDILRVPRRSENRPKSESLRS